VISIYLQIHSALNKLTKNTKQPLQSWPREIKGIPIPTFTRIAIDHFWIRNSEEPSLFICKREALPQFSGSDHSAVVTYLSKKD